MTQNDSKAAKHNDAIAPMKMILRIIAYPFVLGLILVSYNYHAIRNSFLFLLYGGEWTTKAKGDNVMIKDIYEELKQQRNERQ